MSEIKLEKYNGSFEGDKRTYFPAILRWNCSKCGTENEQDFGSDYISYPPLGTPFDYEYLYCSECEHEDHVKLKFDLIIVGGKQ